MSEEYFQFAHPQVFLLLVPLFVLVSFHIKKGPTSYLEYSSLSLIPSTSKSLRERLIFLPKFFWILGLLSLIIALARPQWGSETKEVLNEGIDILLTLDTSGSMRALDFEWEGETVDRLYVVKQVVGDFIKRREFDRIGMVVFGDNAFTQAPLTYDNSILEQLTNWMEIGMVGDGTAIGRALTTSIKRLEKSPAKTKIIVLLTDGRNNAGEVMPDKVAELAKHLGIKIYTIGVGSSGPVPFPQQTPFGQRIIRAELDLDEAMLKEIAKITDATYFRAKDTQSLKAIYDQIDKLEKTEVKTKIYQNFRESYLPFALMGLISLLLSFLSDRFVIVRVP